MLRVRDLMTTDVVTLAPDMSLREAIQLLSSRRVSGAPVMAGEEVAGVLSRTDVISFASSLPGLSPPEPEAGSGAEWEQEAGAPASEPAASYFLESWDESALAVDERFLQGNEGETDVLAGHTVDEAMSRAVHWLSPEESAERAAEQMDMAGVHRLLVLDEGRLAGMISASDIARAVAQHKLARRELTFDRDAEFDVRGWS